MDIHKFSFAEMTSNSKGKTSASIICAIIVILTGCTMGIRGAFSSYADSMLQGLAFVGLGAGLLGIRRFTPDKEIPPSAESSTPTTKKNEDC